MNIVKLCNKWYFLRIMVAARFPAKNRMVTNDHGYRKK